MRRLLAAVGVIILLSTTRLVGVVQAEEAGPTDVVPDSAGMVVRLKAPQSTVTKMAEFVDSVQPGFGIAVSANLPELGRAIGVPGLKGVDLEKDIWMILFFGSEPPPKVVFVLIAKDAKAVTDGLPEDFESHVVGNLVIYSADEDALAEVRKTLGGDGKPLWSKIDATSKKLFDASDLSVLVNIKQLIEDHSEEFEQAEPQLDAYVDNLIEFVPEDQQEQMESVFGLYRDIGKSLLHGIRDSNSWAIGLAFTKTAIRYEDRLQVASDTETSKFLAKQSPIDLPVLNRLPANKGMYVGAKFDMSNMMEWSLKTTKPLLSKANKEQLSQFETAMVEMKELKYEDVNMYIDLEEKAPAVRIGAVTTVSPGKRARDISLKMAKSMNEIKTPQFTQTTQTESNVEKIGSNELDRITIKQEYDDSGDPFGVQNKLQSIMFGDEGMQQLSLFQPNRAFQTVGNGIEEMKGLFAAVESTKPNTSVMTSTRQQLATKANVVVLLDLSRMLSSGLKLAAAEKAPIPLNQGALNRLQLQSSYIGYSLVIDPTALRSQLEIPAAQIQNLVKFYPVFQPQQ